MLHFSSIKAAAILLTTLVVCGFAVPSFLPKDTVKGWPAWAQRRLVLGPDLKGGTSVLFEVDRNDVSAQLLKSLRREGRGALHEAHINLANPVVVRGNGVEAILLESNFAVGFAKLRELSQPVNGVRYLDVVDTGGGLIRITPTAAAMIERTRQTIDQSIPIIEKRINELGLVEPTIQRQGSDRILVQVPGLGDPRRPGAILWE